MDEDITWSERALEIFTSFAKLDGTEVMIDDHIKFYEKLHDENLITGDRYFSILGNIFLSENPDILDWIQGKEE